MDKFYRPPTPFSYYQASAPPPDYTLESKAELIYNFIDRYEINNTFSEKLSLLENYEIVLLLDDSGSMNTPLNDNTSYNTRWDELKANVKIIIELATIYDENGIDIYFLNRSNYYNVKSLNQINNILEEKPTGLTPLTEKLKTIFKNYENSLKPVLVVIATDGLPTKGASHDLSNVKKLLLQKNHFKFFISFLACSDQKYDIGYLNDLDKNVPNVDTLDDYHSEKKEVLSAQGKYFKYTYGDHIVRLLLGPICKDLDKLDENTNCLFSSCNII